MSKLTRLEKHIFTAAMGAIDKGTEGWGEADSPVGSGEVADGLVQGLRVFEQRVREIVREEIAKAGLVAERSDL